MSDAPDDYPDDDCPNCGGSGFVHDCIDGFCEYAEEGCALCEKRCDWCTITNPAKAAPAYECEDCIGMKEHGCYCMAMGASKPGGP